MPVIRLVRPPGIEPGYAASETTILSVELRARLRAHPVARRSAGGKSDFRAPPAAIKTLARRDWLFCAAYAPLSLVDD
jgi:hypothetical protein